MPKKEDLTGRRFGRLVITGPGAWEDEEPHLGVGRQV